MPKNFFSTDKRVRRPGFSRPRTEDLLIPGDVNINHNHPPCNIDEMTGEQQLRFHSCVIVMQAIKAELNKARSDDYSDDDDDDERLTLSVALNLAEMVHTKIETNALPPTRAMN